MLEDNKLMDGYDHQGANFSARVASNIDDLERSGKKARKYSYVVVPESGIWRRIGNKTFYHLYGLHYFGQQTHPKSKTAGIQECINEAKSRVFIKDGAYSTLAKITDSAKTNLTLEGETWAARVSAAASTSQSLFAFTGSNNVIRELGFDGTNTTASLISMSGSYNTFDHNEVANGGSTTGGFGVNLLGNYGWIKRNYVHDTQDDNITLSGSTGSLVTDNVCDTTAAHNNVSCELTCVGIGIHRNRLLNGFFSGIGIENNAAGTPCSLIDITENYIAGWGRFGAGSAGIFFYNPVTGTDCAINCEIADNVIADSYIGQGWGINISSGTYIGVHNNVVLTPHNGIVFGQSGGPNTLTNLDVTGNIIQGATNFAMYDYIPMTNCVVRDNILNGGSVTFAGTLTTCLFKDNIGYNPQAATTGETAGVSPFTVPLKPYDRVVSVTTLNGISAMTLDGTAVSILIDVPIFVAANHTLVMTWAVTAPLYAELPI